MLTRVLGVLNGTVGDYLERTGNALATPMQIIHRGQPLAVERPALEAAYPDASPTLLVLVHGLMGSEADWRAGELEDYGSMLARTRGWSPIYLRYNTGRAISDNGAELAALLAALRASWPVAVDQIVLLCHSLGGLVARAACHAAAGAPWLDQVSRAIYLGTPHRGAPMERLGRAVARLLHTIDDPYTRLLGQIGDLRSAAIKDLGDADLRPEDRARPRHRISLRDIAHPVPLLPHIQHLLIAGTLTHEPWLVALFGDGIVPVASAINRPHAALTTVRIFPGIGHMSLAHHVEVGAELLRWCEP